MAKQKTTWVFLIVNLLFGLFSIAYTEAQPTNSSDKGTDPPPPPPAEEVYTRSARRRSLGQRASAPSSGGNPNNPLPPRGSKDVRRERARIRREEKEKENRREKKKNFASYDGGLEYSFSGADCDVFAFRQGKGDPIHLESIATVSVSVYTAKAPVRRLGHALAVGYTGSIVSVAGSIICYLQNGHPLKKLMNWNRASKHLDKDELLLSHGGEGSSFISGMIYPFDLMLMYKNEIGNTLGMRVSNIEIISEGIVTSINDMATEVVFQFVATHIAQLAPPRPPPSLPPAVPAPPVPVPRPPVRDVVVTDYEFTVLENPNATGQGSGFTNDKKVELYVSAPGILLRIYSDTIYKYAFQCKSYKSVSNEGAIKTYAEYVFRVLNHPPQQDAELKTVKEDDSAGLFIYRYYSTLENGQAVRLTINQLWKQRE